MGGRETALAAIYTGSNKYSMNVVIACAEGILGSGSVYLIRAEGLQPAQVAARLARLSEKHGRVVVLTSFMTPEVPWYLELAKILRGSGCWERVVMVAGGPHPWSDPYGTVASLGFDLAVVGEAEVVLGELLRSVERLRKTRDSVHGAEGVPGLAYRCEDGVAFTGFPRRLGELDESPPFPYWRGMYGPIEITRGCPWGCLYCQVPFMHAAAPRHRSVEGVVEWAERFYRAGLRDLRFVSPNALSYGGDGRSPSVDALDELLARLRRLADRHGGRLFFGTFPSEVRPEFVNPDTMRVLRRAVANRTVILGLQSGSERVLKLINRRHSVDDVLQAVEVANSHGFRVDVDVIFGLPGESLEDMLTTVKVMELMVERYDVRIHAHTFIPLPGAPFGGEKPGVVPREVKKLVYRLVGRGKVYGQWEAQERVARMVAELREARVIYTSRESFRKLRKARG